MPEMRFCVARNLTFCWEEIHLQKLCKSSLQVKISPREDVLCNWARTMDQMKDSLSEVVDDFMAIYEACYEGILTQVRFTPDCLMLFLSQPKILNSLMLHILLPALHHPLPLLPHPRLHLRRLPLPPHEGGNRNLVNLCLIQDLLCLSVGQLLLHLRCRPTW